MDNKDEVLKEMKDNTAPNVMVASICNIPLKEFLNKKADMRIIIKYLLSRMVKEE